MKPFFKLRLRMMEQDQTGKSPAERIERSPTYVTQFLAGKGCLTTKDIIKAAAVLGIGREEIGEYFFPEVERRGKDNGIRL